MKSKEKKENEIQANLKEKIKEIKEIRKNKKDNKPEIILKSLLEI